MASYTPSICGNVTETFAVKIEEGTVFYHEWRDWPNTSAGYNAGPSLYIYGDGTLAANWVTLGTVPMNQWLLFTLNAEVGGSDGTWSLAVEQEDGSIQSWSALPGGALAELNWVGFVANGTEEGRFWLDDLDLR
jgi:hypothetical protein